MKRAFVNGFRLLLARNFLINSKFAKRDIPVVLFAQRAADSGSSSTGGISAGGGLELSLSLSVAVGELHLHIIHLLLISHENETNFSSKQSHPEKVEVVLALAQIEHSHLIQYD